jgi:hypothetical protein
VSQFCACDRFLPLPDGTATPDGIHDEYTASGPEPTLQSDSRIQVGMFVDLAIDGVRPRFDVVVRCLGADGFVTQVADSHPVLSPGPGRLVIARPVDFPATTQGTYYFTLEIDGVEIARLPLGIRYQQRQP